MTDKAFLRGFLSSNWVVGGETEPIEDHYILKEQHGETGSDGYAVKAVHKRTGDIRAVKIMSKDGWEKDDFVAHRQEVKLLKCASHHNIVEVYDVYETQETLYIAMEFLGGGELYDRIEKKGRCSEAECAAVMRDAAAGLKELHSKNIVHRDLKPGNFLCASPGTLLPIKIIDLGFAKQCLPGKYLNAVVGTPYFVAPEVLKQAYTIQCDIWSLGAILFIMAFGYPPYSCEDIQSPDMRKQRETAFSTEPRPGQGPWIPSTVPVSEGFKRLIGSMLAIEPSDRPTAAVLTEDEWLREYSTKYDEEKKNNVDRKSGSRKKKSLLKKKSAKRNGAKHSHKHNTHKHNSNGKGKDTDEDGGGGLMRMLSKGNTVMLKSTDLPPTHKTPIKHHKSNKTMSAYPSAKKKASLGVKMEKSEEDEGIVVSVLKRNHPCDLAGLQQGDLVLRVNGAIVNTVAAFADIAKQFPASPLSFNVKRDGQVHRITVSASDIRKRSRSRSASRERTPRDENYSSDDYT